MAPGEAGAAQAAEAAEAGQREASAVLRGGGALGAVDGAPPAVAVGCGFLALAPQRVSEERVVAEIGGKPLGAR